MFEPKPINPRQTVISNLLFIAIVLLFPVQILAQSIKGLVTDQNGAPLSYITVSLKDSNLNTYTNQEGYFEFKLNSGTYELVLHAIDFQTVKLTVELANQQNKLINVVLMPQTYQLSEMTVRANQKNPAVYIMRKAIAMAPYYRRQVLSYKAKVYLKGNGVFEKIPGMLKKMMLNSQIEEGKSMLTESVNELQFFQPSTYRERVLSLKSNMKLASAPEPMQMVRGSFYNTSNQELVSPLSPQAFSVYEFTYEGSFMDAGVEVNKIKVTPKRAGSDVYQGTIYIIDQLWCIHSLNLNNTGNLFEVSSKAKFAPVASFPFVWMPISYDFEFKGAMLGFKAKFHYLAALSGYQIKLNPNLNHVWQEAIKSEKALTKNQLNANKMVKALSQKTNPSKLEMLRVLSKIKKDAAQNQHSKITVDSSELSIDATAYNKDSLFWQSNRIVSLDEHEVKAYAISDTVVSPEVKSRLNKPKKDGLSFGLLLNGSYVPKDSSKMVAYWQTPLSGLFLNTVDGWGLKLTTRFETAPVNNRNWTYTLKGSIPFERKALNGSIAVNWLNKSHPQHQVLFEIGSDLKDFNPNGASALPNAFQLLFYQSNNTRLFQEDYIKTNFSKPLHPTFVLHAELKVANRNSLENCYRFEQLESKHIGITPNNVTGDGPFLRSLDFSTYQLCNLKLGVDWKIGQKLIKRKGKYQIVSSKFPAIAVDLTKSLPGIWGSDLDYTKINIKLSQQVHIWHWLEVKYIFEAGRFLQTRTLKFPDYFSFDGNTAWFMNDDSRNRFFNLPFYMYSTNKQFVLGKMELQFKRLALLRLPYLNKTNFKESIKINFLGTPEYHKYTELAYGMVNIFKLFDCYLYTNYYNSNYQDWGFRLNLTLPLTF